jgi:HicB family
MELSDYVGTLRSELASITRFAGEDIKQAAEALAEALDSSVRLTLLDVLSAAAEEITTRLEDTVIHVRLSAGEPEFVVSTAPAHVPDEPPAPGLPDGFDDSGTARITLRLSESLKARVDAAATAAGISVNGWLAHAAARALENPDGPGVRRARTGIGQRITGYARS